MSIRTSGGIVAQQSLDMAAGGNITSTTARQRQVLAWVEYAGDYAFELDWKSGQFLWGYFLERG